MKVLVLWIGRWVPATLLLVIGIETITARFVPSLDDRTGHAPLPLSIGMIVLGGLSMALSLWVARLRRRYRQYVAAKRVDP
ncbi:MAG TPA: hypothetical protein VG939_05650 [Caulobacteraceae bacterium]|nr:hypothetical protein [Caulobacteraceae bacterium]